MATLPALTSLVWRGLGEWAVLEASNEEASVSQASMSQKLDAARKATKEERQKGVDFHIAYPNYPPVFCAYMATLVQEATDPSRVASELGVHVNGGERRVGQRSNRAAQAELDRIYALLLRIGERGMGSGDGKYTGQIERIIYGANSSNTGDYGRAA